MTLYIQHGAIFNKVQFILIANGRFIEEIIVQTIINHLNYLNALYVFVFPNVFSRGLEYMQQQVTI